MKFTLIRKVDKFWLSYFCVRLFYLFVATLVYGKLTSLGDTERYLNATTSFSWVMFYKSTYLMDFIGSIFGRLGGLNPVSNLPFMLLSFFSIKWAITKLDLYSSANKYLLFVIISLPNFCIWTSVCSKETFGLVFSSILGVWFISYLRNDFSFKWIYLLGIYLCLIFKPQYFPFVLQGLFFLFCAKYQQGKLFKLALFFVILFLNIALLYYFQEAINQVASLMYRHFATEDAQSSKNLDFFIEHNSFFLKSAHGMFEGFIGPTFSEMSNKFTHFLAGVESYLMVFILLILFREPIFKFIFLLRVDIKIMAILILVFLGILFVHYPFGIFNAGSAIRYRTNFLFFFILIALEIKRSYLSKVYVVK